MEKIVLVEKKKLDHVTAKRLEFQCGEFIVCKCNLARTDNKQVYWSRDNTPPYCPPDEVRKFQRNSLKE